MIETDEQLMVRLSQGDKKAFEHLFLKYKDKLYSYIYRFCGDAAVSEEIFQEAFLRVYRYAPQYEPIAKFSTFLYRITTNLCLNELKRHRLMPMYFLGSLRERKEGQGGMIEDDIKSMDRSPDQHVFSQELQEHLRTALDQLPAAMKATLLLSEVEGKKYDEIARILNCSVGTVKSRVNRSRSKLLEYLDSHDIL
ncbi:sigma-70 family RNA polymerase sigma factor [bacterium]|nr:sigma-70 family RNA polymerase sigma factor [bacterium]